MNLNWHHVQQDVQDLLNDSVPALHLLKALKFNSVKVHPDFCTILLSVENKLTLQMCERLFIFHLRKVLEAKLLSPVQFEFSLVSSQEPFAIVDCLVQPEILPEEKSPAINKPTQYKFKSKFSLNPHYNFENFLVTEENRLARMAVAGFALDIKKDFSLLLISGPSGTGKTHLLNSAGWDFLRLKPKTKVKLISGDELITDFQSAIQRRSMNDFRAKYRGETEVLLIDDIHCLERAKATQMELFNLINDYQQNGKKIILTCDRPFQGIAGFDERLTSRLLGGVNVELTYPSLPSKHQILCYKMEKADIELSENLIERILLSCGPCVRSVEGALNRIKMLVQTAGVLEPAALEKMFPQITEAEQKTIGIDAALLKICSQHGISIKELKGASRKRNLVMARRQVAVLLKSDFHKSIADIGRLLQRDHSTIVSLLKSADIFATK